MKKLAVFASGTGSNFQAIIDAVERGDLSAEIQLLVCDNPNAKAIERAERHGIATFVFNPKQFASKKAFESEILMLLQKEAIDWVVLAGYMRLIGPTLLDVYTGRILNIHPSLLPSFPGKDAIGQALAFGVKVTGVTVHYVDEGMDTGKIIAQEAVAIVAGETTESLQVKIQQVEHDLYIRAIAAVM